jgi:hypothetical protein
LDHQEHEEAEKTTKTPSVALTLGDLRGLRGSIFVGALTRALGGRVKPGHDELF